jgi:hypothetical protein
MDIVQHRDAEQPGDFGCAQSGCTICLEKLLQQHAGLVHCIVRRQWPGDADYADLIQEGWIGLWLAILHFDPGRGFTFSTYAARAIRNRVWNAVKQAWRAEGWLEPQRAGDSLSVILASWQQEQLHQALQDELGCFTGKLAAGDRAGLRVGWTTALESGRYRAAAGRDTGVGAADA